MKLNLFSKKQEKTEMEVWYGKDLDFSGVRNAIAPSVINEQAENVQFGDNYARTITIIDYPSNVKGNWLSKLYRFKGNLSISIHMVPASAEKMIQSISGSVEELEIRLDSHLSPRRKQDTKNKLESANKLLKKLMEGDNNIIYHVHMYLHLQAESVEELERMTKKLKGLLWRAGLTPAIPNDNMLKAFKAVLPIVENSLPEYTFRNMDAEAASSLFPFDESEIFEQSGVVKGMNVTTGSLVLIDQYKLKNHNEFILGMSGSGKSFYMKKDMLRHFMMGIRIFIIDPEREYKDVIRAIGGQHVNISSMSGTVINPLEIMHSQVDRINMDSEEDDEDVSLLHQKIGRLKIFFKLIKKDLSPLESALIEDMLVATYQEKGITWDTDFTKKVSKDFPILEDLYKQIEGKSDERLDDFMAILKTYVSGSNSLMFNGITNVNMANEVICFDLKDLEDESDVQPAAMFNVLSFLWDEITRDRTSLKRLYVDEAHIMSDPDNPRAMKFLFNIYKRIRKYKGGATAATQQIADYLSAIEGKRNYGKAVIGNSQSKLILSLEPSDIEDLKRYNAVKLSEEEERILTTDKKGEGIFVVGKNRVHLKVDYTPEELKIIDSELYSELYVK
ncbi:ATP-binding protein [Bacillus cereus]|uniref:VirB4 family type IV secretion system protein n=1 Tax=Bacillus cereus TaxID=1396 RepID=UPI00211281C2|nr:ATP-binding protein [Bacillus cereus]